MDKIFASKIEKFLAIEKPTDAQIIEGATLLLQISPARNRAIYNSAMRRPQSMLPWIRTDLQKHLKIMQRGLTPATVQTYNMETVKRVDESLSVPPDSVKLGNSRISDQPVLGTRGKRADHESLPEDIQELWEQNTQRWQTMRKVRAQLAQMVAKPDYAACDGNELCYQLRQMDDALRAAYQKYDSWTPPTVAEGKKVEKVDSVDAFTDNMKTIQNARTTISRGLSRQKQSAQSLQKIQDAVNTLISLHQNVKPDTLKKLSAIGITVPSGNA